MSSRREPRKYSQRFSPFLYGSEQNVGRHTPQPFEPMNSYVELTEGDQEFKTEFDIGRCEAQFSGACYLCGQPKHSQNHCPLKKCGLCNSYGHGERACCLFVGQ